MQLWHRWEKQMHCHFTDIITGNQVPKVTQLEEEPEMQGKNAFYPALSWALSQIGPPQMNETQDWSLPATFCPRHLSLYIVRLLWHGAFSIHSLRAILLSVQFTSVTQSYLTLCNPMECSTPGFPVHHQLLEPTQTHVHCIGDAIQLSHPLVIPFSSHLQSFPASGSFPMSWFFASGGQSVGVSASASVLPMSI